VSRSSTSPRPRAIALATLILLAGAAGASPASAQPPRTTLPAVEAQVMCVTCKIPLTVAQSPQANRERAYIQNLIDQGADSAQIKRELVSQYGPAVLSLPSSHGFDLTVYLIPIIVGLALLATLALLLPRWRRRARTAQSELPEPSPALSPADAARLEADMARFD
jgi:cytochrome c-type biogenesis protein CcmH